MQDKVSMQNSGVGLPAGIVIVAMAAHFALQMITSPAWTHFLPLLAAVAAIALLPDQPVTGGRRDRRAAVLAIACFLASYILSLVFSTDPRTSLAALLALLPGPLVFALTLQLQPPHTRQLAVGVNAGLIAGALYLATVFLAFGSTEPGLALENRYSAAFVVPNDVLFLVCLAPFSLELLLRQEGRSARVFAGIGLVSVLAVLVLAESRAGLLVAASVLGVYALSYSWRPVLLGAALLAIALILVDWSQGFPFLEKLLKAEKLGFRLVLWWAGIESFLQFPLTGHGPGTFDIIYRDLRASGTLPETMNYETRRVGWAHSLYIEALAERGIFGLLTLLGLLGTALALAVRGLRRTGRRTWLFPVAVSLIALLLAGAIELTFMRTWVISLSFLLLGLCVIHGQTGDTR